MSNVTDISTGLDIIAKVTGRRTYEIFSSAFKHYNTLLAVSRDCVGRCCADLGIDSRRVSFAVVGSVGRAEALEASDFDLVPIAEDAETLQILLTNNEALRARLASALRCDVSRGRDLMQAVSLPELTDPERIGGEKDGRNSLTKRMALVTECAQAGGDLPLAAVRKAIIDAYARKGTVGRHPMAFSNDLARFYRTLFMDYKERIDTTAKDWCSRNVKLRHSRKLCYFATMMAIARVVTETRRDGSEFVERLLEYLDLPPVLRLLKAVTAEAQLGVGRVLDHYGWYLEFMSSMERRAVLAKVSHAERYSPSPDNPYPALQWNSKMMHAELIAVLRQAGPEVESRVLEWFLL